MFNLPKLSLSWTRLSSMILINGLIFGTNGLMNVYNC